jgi:hypothetical protein
MNPTIGTIGRASVLGGSIDQRFITIVGANLRAIALAADTGHIYWSWITGSYPSSQQGIGRATIDGGAVEQSFIPIPTDVFGPSVGAVAVGGPYLFWVQRSDGVSGEVIRVRLDGTGSSSIVVPPGQSGKDPTFPHSLAADSQNLYYDDFGALNRVDLNGGGLRDVAPGPVYTRDYAPALDSSYLYWSRVSEVGQRGAKHQPGELGWVGSKPEFHH